MCKVFVRPRSDQDGMNERGTATLASSAGKVLADADEREGRFLNVVTYCSYRDSSRRPNRGAVPN